MGRPPLSGRGVLPNGECELSDAEARTEAISLVTLMRNGVNCNDVLYLDEQTRKTLLAFRDFYPEDAWLVDRSLSFRKKVNAHVKRLLEGVHVEGRGAEAELPAGGQGGSGQHEDEHAAVGIQGA